MEQGFDLLDWPVQRVCGAEVPMPYAKHLEEAALPSAERVVAAVTRDVVLMAEFVMPSLGADMSAGTLAAWLKQPGDAVERGDIIAVVHTDKADVEVEVFTSGVIEQLLVEPGTEVPVGTPLAVIREEGVAAAPAPAAPLPPLRPHRRLQRRFRRAGGAPPPDLALGPPARARARRRARGDPRIGPGRPDPAPRRRGGRRGP